MKTVARISALVAALVMISVFAACRGGEKPSPAGTAAPAETESSAQSTELAITPEVEARIKELAGAFALFGECDMSDGVSMHSIAEMIYCRYTLTLEESDRKGFGKVNGDEAREEAATIFGFDELNVPLPKYREDEDQDYFLDGEDCYVRLTDPADCRTEIVSIEPCVLADGRQGIRAMANAETADEGQFSIVMWLTTSRTGKLCIDKCEKQYAM